MKSYAAGYEHFDINARTWMLSDGIDPKVAALASAIVREELVWDNHACMPLRPQDRSFLPRLEELRAVGVDIVALNVGFGPIDVATHLAMVDSLTRWLEAQPDRYVIVHRIGDVEEARRSGRMGVLFDVEGMAPLDRGRLDLVETFRRGGVGWMLVAYNQPNDAGGGCVGEDGGLTAYGRAVLAEMKRVGMIVCCSHTGRRTALDVLAAADNPVIFSHSNPSAVFAHYRNIGDDLIRGCAETGGVVGINGLGAFHRGNDPSPALIADNIDYVAQLVGINHVGIASDYVFDVAELATFLEQMRAAFPEDSGLDQPLRQLCHARLPDVVAALITRGYARADIAKVLGGNWRRVAAQVWN